MQLKVEAAQCHGPVPHSWRRQWCILCLTVTRLFAGMGYRPMPYIDSTLIRFRQGRPETYKSLVDSIDDYLKRKNWHYLSHRLLLGADTAGSWPQILTTHSP